MSPGTTDPEIQLKTNGTKTITLAQLVVYVALVGGTGTMCTVAKTCTHDAAPVMGLQTLKAAEEAELTNTSEHVAIIETIKEVDHKREQDRVEMMKQQQATHEAVIETLEAISPRRAKKLRTKNKKP